MKENKINLQLFADEAETPVEETTETEPTDEKVETEETPEFDNSEETDEETKEEDKKAKKNTNRENAERRIAERQRKEQDKKEREAEEKAKKAERAAYLKGIKKALGDKNPYTDKPIIDDEDLEEYEIMKKLEDEGKDPVEDYAEYIKQQKREAKQQQEALSKKESEQLEFVNNGIKEVDAKYGEGSAKKFLESQDFIDFGKDFLDAGVKLSVVVDKFLEIEAKIKSESDNKLLEKQARKMSSPGGLTSGSASSQKSIKEMTDDEFKAFNNSLLNSY